jgi:hypothetical protein
VNARAFADMLPLRFWRWGTWGMLPYAFERYARLIDHVTTMTAPGNLELLACAVACLEPGECYLEVGTWRGGTLIGALSQPGTLAHGYGVDSGALGLEHSPDGKTGAEAWAEHIAWAGLAERAHYISGEVPALTVDVPPVGVYLFDGDKTTTEAAYAGLAWALHYLAPRALIVVDDANVLEIRMAVAQFARDHGAQIILDIPTPGHGWPTFWNGTMVLYRETHG